MATLHETVKSLFAAATASVLPGGVFDANDTNQRDWGGYDWAKEIGLIDDNMQIVPHAKLSWKDSTAFQTEHPALGAERESVEVYVYDQLGYSTIDQAIPIVKQTLHNQFIQNTDDRQIAKAFFVFVSGEMMAEEYHNRPMKFVRFSIVHIR